MLERDVGLLKKVLMGGALFIMLWVVDPGLAIRGRANPAVLLYLVTGAERS